MGDANGEYTQVACRCYTHISSDPRSIVTRRLCIQADLAGEVVLFSLSLTEKGGKGMLAKQLYTFGVLKASESIHANMTAIQPMKPLLHAPPAQCTIAKPQCAAVGAVCS